MATSVCGVFEAPNAGPTNGASVDLWLASRFGGQPAQGASAPGGGGADYGPVTTGTTYGSAGSWTITGVAAGDYYARYVYNSVNYWSGSFTAVANSDLVHISGTETVTGNKTFSGTSAFSGSSSFAGGVTGNTAFSGTPAFNGGLTATNLITSYAAITTNTNAVSGTGYFASNTITVTLPAPATGAIVFVNNSGSGVVTISQHAAELIYGPLWNGVASLTMPANNNSFITLVSPTGAYWNVVEYGPGNWPFYTNLMGSDTNAWTISGIPGGFNSIEIDVYARLTGAVVSGQLAIQFNGDTGGNYYGCSSTDFAAPTNYSGGTFGVPGIVNGASAQASFFGHSHIVIPAYTQTANYHNFSASGGFWQINTAGTHVTQCFGAWGNLAAITSIVVGGASNLKAGSQITMWLK